MSQVAFLNNGVIPPPGPLLTLTGNTGGPVPPTAGNINIITANSTVLFAGNAGTSTITQDFGLTNLILGSHPAIAGAIQNVGLGDNALISLTSGSSNVALGYLALSGVNTGTTNIGIGVSAGAALANGTHNVAIGNDALEVAVGVTESTALGDGTLSLLTSGNNNTAIGSGALSDLLTGTSNTVLGINAGTNYTTSESSNLLLGNLGATGESHVIRIGQQGSGLAQQDTAFIAGVYGVTPSGTPQTVVINSSGQLGSTSSGGGGIMTIDGDSGSITGSTVTIFANNATNNSGSSVAFVNSGTTSTFNVTDSNFNTMIGKAAGNASISGVDNVALGSGAGKGLTSGTSNVLIGNAVGFPMTSDSSNVGVGADALRFANGSNNNTSVGANSLFNLINGASNIAIGGNSNSAFSAGGNYTGSESNNICIGSPGVVGESNAIRIGQSNTTGIQILPGNLSFINADLSHNVFMGSNSGNFTLSASNNTAYGWTSGQGLTSGAQNTFIGASCASGGSISGSDNSGLGRDSLNLLDTGSFNTALGAFSLSGASIGSNNIGIGYESGTGFTGGEAGNIILGSVTGTSGDSNIMRLGNDGTVASLTTTQTYMQGIYGNTPALSPQTVIIGSDGQLGTSGGGGSGIITIDGNTGSITGSTVTIAGDDGATVTTSALSATELILQLTDSNNNISIGTNSGNNGISGSSNTFVGALSADQNNKSGTDNVGLGFQSLQFLSSGTQNVAIGSGSLSALLTGSNNVCVGYNSGASIVSTGVNGENTCIGTLSGQNITTSLKNTALGSQALKGNGAGLTGTGLNVAVGYVALTNLSTGTSNTAIGQTNLNNITTGSNNTCIGALAGSGYSTGSESSNICINSQGTNNESNVLRIGQATGTSAYNLNKAFICGINGITVTGTAVLVSSSDQLGIAVSSRKYKDNIQDMANDSSSVMKLRPVTFTLKEYSDKTKQFGLIAEEVYEIMPELVVLDKEGQPQSVQYHNLPVILLNEIQKLRNELNELKLRVG